MVISQGSMADTWITPYQLYLANGLFPSEPTEPKAIKRNSRMYTLIDGKLFRHRYAHPALICVSGDQGVRVMAELHEGICGSHLVSDNGTQFANQQLGKLCSKLGICLCGAPPKEWSGRIDQ